MPSRGLHVRAGVTFLALLSGIAPSACGNLDYDASDDWVPVNPLRRPRTDYDHDQRGDLFVLIRSDQGAELRLYGSSGEGFWETPGIVFRKSLSMADAHATVVDLHGDGFADVLLARANPANLGQTEFDILDGLAMLTSLEAEPPTETAPAVGRLFGVPPDRVQIAAGDVTGDGQGEKKGDLVFHVVDKGQGSLWYIPGGAPKPLPGLWEQAHLMTTPSAHFATAKIAVADLDGDGMDDVVMAVPDGQATELWMVVGGPKPALLDQPIGRLEEPLAALTFAGGDVTGDGYGDLLVHVRHGERGSLEILRGHPRGLWPRPLVVFADDPRMAEIKLVTTDVDNDGAADIILARRNGSATEIYWNRGDRHPTGPGTLRYTFNGVKLEDLDLG
jgi:hypothetical protein